MPRPSPSLLLSLCLGALALAPAFAQEAPSPEGGLSWQGEPFAEVRAALGAAEPGPALRAALGTVEAMGPLARGALPELRRLSEHPDPGVRAGAVQALGALGQEALAARPRLQALLADPALEVRRAAALALGALGPGAGPAVPALAAAWVERDLRPDLARGLAGIGSASLGALPQLREGFLMGRGEERQRAGEALASVGGEGVEPLLLVARDSGRPPELRSLGYALAGRVRGARAPAVRAELWQLLLGSDPQGWELGVEGLSAQAEWDPRVLELRFKLNAALSNAGDADHKRALTDLKRLLSEAEPFLKGVGGDPARPAAVPALVELLARGQPELAAQAEEWLLLHARRSMAVVEALEQLPPRFPRAEAFLRQLTGKAPLPAADDVPTPAKGQRYVYQTRIDTGQNPLTMDMTYTIDEVHGDRIVYSIETTVLGHTTTVPAQEWRVPQAPAGAPQGRSPQGGQVKRREETLTIAGRTWRARVDEVAHGKLTTTTWTPLSDQGPTWPPFLKVHSVNGQSTTHMELIKVELPSSER